MALSGDVIGRAVVEIVGDSTKLTADFRKAEQESRSAVDRIGKSMVQTGASLSAGLTAPIAAFGVAAVKGAIDFESSFAGIRKTVDATEPEFQRLAQSMRQMSMEIPVGVNELNAIGEAAGQLGIKTENIASFTRVMADLGVATNMSSVEAATSLARLANITGMAQSDFDRLGSTIVSLGNNFATTESEIVSMGLRLAGAGSQIGLSEHQILAFATALSSVGIEAEAGGSAFSKVMIQIASEVENSGDKLADFARVAGMSAEEFAEKWRTDPAAALIAFVEGLGNMESQGSSTLQVLEELGITEVRMRDALLRSSGAAEGMAQALGLAGDAWEENTALATEAEQRYGTVASQLAILKNTVMDLAITMGQQFLPHIVSIVGGLTEFVQGLGETNPEVLKLIGIVGGIAAAAGPVLVTLGGMAIAIAALSPPILLVTGGVGALALAFGVLAVDADKLPTPLRIAVELLQSLGEVLPIAAGGIGALLAAMAFARVTSFALSITDLSTALGGLQRVMMSPVGALGLFVGALVAANEASKAFTGKSLIENLKGTDHAARGAAEGVRDFELAMAAAGKEADPFTVGTQRITRHVQNFNKFVEEFTAKHGPLMAQMMRETGNATEEYAGRIAGAVREMDAQNVSALELVQQLRELPPELRAAVEAQLDMERITARANGEIRDMAPAIAEQFPILEGFLERLGLVEAAAAPTAEQLREMALAAEAQVPALTGITGALDAVLVPLGLLPPSAEAAARASRDMGLAQQEASGQSGAFLSSLGLLSEELGTVEGAIDAVNDAIDIMIGRFADLNPEVALLKAEQALLVEAMNDLLVKGDELTESDKERIEAYEEEIEALDRRIAGYEDNQTAMEGMRTAVENLIGPAGLGGLLQAMSDANLGAEEQIDVMGGLIDVYRNLEDHGVETAIGALGRLKNEMDPVEWQILAEAVGPALIDGIQNGIADPAKQSELLSKAESLGIDTSSAVGTGITGGAGEIIAAASNIPGWIIGAASGGDYESIGLNAVFGIMRGLYAGQSSVAGAAINVAQSLVGGLQSGLRSKSPSKETEEKAGIPAAQGVAVGLEKGIPLVVGAVSSMVQAMRAQAEMEAPTFADDFAAALSGAQFRTRLEAALGPMGADVMEAITKAMATGKGGDSIIKAVEKMIEEATSLGVPAAGRLGEQLMDAIALAMATGSADALAVVEDLLIRMNDAIVAFQPTVFSTFLDAHRNAQLREELVALYGELGADIAEALDEAINDPTGASGQALYDTIIKMIDEAEKVGVPNAAELGAEIISAMVLAIQTGSPEAVEAVLDTIKALDRAVQDASHEPARSLVEGFMDGYRRARDSARLEELLGSDGAKFIEALIEGMESKDPDLLETIGDMAYGLIQTLTEGLRPEEGAEIATKFMDLLKRVISEEGDAVIQELIDLLAEIEAANKPDAGKGVKEPDNTGTGAKLVGTMPGADGQTIQVWQGRSGLFRIGPDGRKYDVGVQVGDGIGTTRELTLDEMIERGLITPWQGDKTKTITKKELDDHIASLDITSLDTGLARVPYDGYLASLHRDEAVLNKAQAEQWRAGGDVSVTVNVAGDGDPLKIKAAVQRGIEEWKRNELGVGAAHWGVA